MKRKPYRLDRRSLRRAAGGLLPGLLPGLLLLAALPALAPAPAAAVDYTYDNLDRLTSVTLDDGKRINYRYDPAGNVLLIWMGLSTEVAEIPPDARFLAVRNPAPNPFNARVEIAFEIKAEQKVSLRLYDLRGRMVRELVDEVFEPGLVRVVWDGRTDRGAAAASGAYFARIKTEHRVRTVPMMMVK